MWGRRQYSLPLPECTITVEWGGRCPPPYMHGRVGHSMYKLYSYAVYMGGHHPPPLYSTEEGVGTPPIECTNCTMGALPALRALLYRYEYIYIYIYIYVSNEEKCETCCVYCAIIIVCWRILAQSTMCLSILLTVFFIFHMPPQYFYTDGYTGRPSKYGLPKPAGRPGHHD